MEPAIVTPELLLASGWEQKNHFNGFVEYKKMVQYTDDFHILRKKKQSVTYYTTCNGVNRVHVRLSHNFNVFDETIRADALTIAHFEDALRVCDLSDTIKLNHKQQSK